MTIPELFLLEFDEEMPSTRRILERVPEASFSWQPHEKSMTLGRLASHVAELPARCATIVATETYVRQPGTPPYLAASSAELLEKFSSTSAEARAALLTLRDDHFPSSGPSRWVTALSPRCLALWPSAASSWITTSTIALSSASICASSISPSPVCTAPPPTIRAGRNARFQPAPRAPAARRTASPA